MTPDIHVTGSVDERLRRDLDPAPPTVDRVVRRALGRAPVHPAPAPRGRRRRWLVAAAGAAAAVVLVAVGLRTVPLLWHQPPPAPAEARVSLVNVGSVIVLDTGRDGRTVLLSGVRASREAPWRGQIIIQRKERP